MKPISRLFPGWALIALVVLLLSGAAAAWAAPPAIRVRLPGQSGVGYDPLTGAEQELALRAASVVSGVGAASVRTSTPEAAGEPVVSAPGEEVLLVERHQENKEAMSQGNWPRRADVYVYRYADDTLVHSLYNYESGQIDLVEEAQGTQLPLTQAERELAVEIALGDPALRSLLNGEYTRITGQPLNDAEQLDVRVFVYIAGAAPELETPAAAACGLNRCAQLLILTPDNATLEYLPIINLSTLKVASSAPLALNQENGGE
jgi:hypothetical protein